MKIDFLHTIKWPNVFSPKSQIVAFLSTKKYFVLLYFSSLHYMKKTYVSFNKWGIEIVLGFGWFGEISFGVF